jgi:hypothetical protein
MTWGEAGQLMPHHLLEMSSVPMESRKNQLQAGQPRMDLPWYSPVLVSLSSSWRHHWAKGVKKTSPR